MPSPRRSEVEAVALADGLRVLLDRWFRQRGVRGAPPFGVSPYVTAAGVPAVVIRMDAYAAHALLHSLDEHAGDAGDGGRK